jgi:hypothetical protein
MERLVVEELGEHVEGDSRLLKEEKQSVSKEQQQQCICVVWITYIVGNHVSSLFNFKPGETLIGLSMSNDLALESVVLEREVIELALSRPLHASSPLGSSNVVAELKGKQKFSKNKKKRETLSLLPLLTK